MKCGVSVGANTGEAGVLGKTEDGATGAEILPGLAHRFG